MPTVWRHTQIKSGLILAHVDIYIYIYRTCVCILYIYIISLLKIMKNPHQVDGFQSIEKIHISKKRKRISSHGCWSVSFVDFTRVVTVCFGMAPRRAFGGRSARGESHSRAVDDVRIVYVQHTHTHLCVYLSILQYVCRMIYIYIYIYIVFYMLMHVYMQWILYFIHVGSLYFGPSAAPRPPSSIHSTLKVRALHKKDAVFEALILFIYKYIHLSESI